MPRFARRAGEEYPWMRSFAAVAADTRRPFAPSTWPKEKSWSDACVTQLRYWNETASPRNSETSKRISVREALTGIAYSNRGLERVSE
jgi:hypothetical protein